MSLEFSAIETMKTFFGGNKKISGFPSVPYKHEIPTFPQPVYLDWSKIKLDYFKDKNRGSDKDFTEYFHQSASNLENWPELTEYDYTQANVKPVEATTRELGEEIDRLKNEVQKQTDAKNKAINNHHYYMDEYRKLENDFYNRGTEMKELQEKLNKLQDVEKMNVWLMKQHLNHVEEKGEK